MIAKLSQFKGLETDRLKGITSPGATRARRQLFVARQLPPRRRTSIPSIRQAGITIIEVLVVLAVIAITVGFAGKASQDVSYRADLRVAEEVIQQSVRMARNTARMKEQEVWLTFSNKDEDDQLRVELVTQSDVRYAQVLDDIRLPQGIVILSPDNHFEFDRLGIVDFPGTLVFAAVDHEDEFRQVSISN